MMETPGFKTDEPDEPGRKVRVHHLRTVTCFGQTMLLPRHLIRAHSFDLDPKGGVTLVELMDGAEVLATGEAFCSTEDNYSRKRGLAIAYGRALEQWRQHSGLGGKT